MTEKKRKTNEVEEFINYREYEDYEESDEVPEWVERMDEASCPIDLYVDAFIPARRVANPSPVALPGDAHYYSYFSGDRRKGPEKGGSARMWSSVLVDLCASSPLLHAAHDTGVTLGYRYETRKVRDVQWYKLLTPAYRVFEVIDRAKAPTTGMMERVRKEGACKVYIKVVGSAPNPLISLAPNIDYRFRCRVWCEKDEDDETIIKYRLTGQHDGFPAYSVFLGDTLIYNYDPNITEEGPLSLFGTGEYRVEREGEITPTHHCDCEAGEGA